MTSAINEVKAEPRVKIFCGNLLSELLHLADNSVDAIVTDPPYGLSKEPDISEVMKHWISGSSYTHNHSGFMGKTWDSFVPGPEYWKQIIRVLKPGGHVLCFSGTRTYDLMTISLRFAGFEIRDQVQWIYGSGFPKSLDVSKAIDKAAGAEREIVGVSSHHSVGKLGKQGDSFNLHEKSLNPDGITPLTAPATDSAKRWQGWGTALKPANEPIVLARKPLEKGLTVAQNVEKWGCGAINVDAGRIGMQPAQTYTAPDITGDAFNSDVSKRERKIVSVPAQGRRPANVLFDEQAAEMLDEQSGQLQGDSANRKPRGNIATDGVTNFGTSKNAKPNRPDSDGASRFFYVAKTSKRERNAGLEGMPLKISGGMSGTLDGTLKTGSGNERNNLNQNSHPTVKPIKLMEYLCKLITPPGGIILDPFMGSGSTGCAAINLGYNFIGCEMMTEYSDIAIARIKHAKKLYLENKVK